MVFKEVGISFLLNPVAKKMVDETYFGNMV